jgi:tetratricopeptide (TPR) repeat protein
LDDKYDTAEVLRRIGACYQSMGQLEQAIQFAQQSLDLRRQIGDQSGASICLLGLGISTFMAGDYALTESYWQEGLAIGSQIGRPSAITLAKGFLSLLAFLTGEFAAASALAEEAHIAAQDLGDPEGEQIPLITLGMVANLEEDYRRAKRILMGTQFLHEAQLFAAWGLSVAEFGLRDYQRAKGHIQTGIKQALALHSPAWVTLFLPVTSLILMHEGEKERAVELLSLAFNHAASATGWLEKWPLLVQTRANLEKELSANVYAVAWERGQALELEAVVKGIPFEADTLHLDRRTMKKDR